MDGVIRGSIVHIHRARTVTIKAGGLITASGRGDILIDPVYHMHRNTV